MSRDIWTYWEGPIPKLVQDCWDSWKKYATGWNIHILNPEAVKNMHLNLPSTFDSISPQMRSDCIRMDILYTYGGLWMDASIMLHRDLDWLIDHVREKNVKNFTGFYFLSRMESWFMYMPNPKDKYTKLYRDTFFEAVELYPDVFKSPIYSIGNYTENPYYFVIYQTYFYLYNTNQDFRYIVDTNELLPKGYKNVLPVLDFSNTRPLTKYTTITRNLSNMFAAAIILVSMFAIWALMGNNAIFTIIIIVGLIGLLMIIMNFIYNKWILTINSTSLLHS